MPRVKIVWSNHISVDYGESDISILAGPATAWDELSDAEVEVLRSNLHFLRHPSKDYNYRPHLLIDTGISPRIYLEQAILAKQQDDERRAKAQKVREQIKKKRAKTAQERRKAQFDKLRREFDG